jgi:hypothetical protein
MRYSKHILFALGIIAFQVSSLLAQASSGSAAPRLRFLFLDESPGAYYVSTDGQQKELISSGPFVISSPYKPSRSMPLQIYKELADPLTGIIRKLPVARVIPPAETSSAIVIVSPRPRENPEAELDYQVEVINADADVFPSGTIGVINRAEVAMAAQFGDKQIALLPGETKIVHPSTDARYRYFSRVAARTENGWKAVSDTISVVRPQERIIGIFVYSPSGMRNTYTAAEIEEFGPPKPGNFWLTFSDTP